MMNQPTFRGCSIDHLTQAEALDRLGNNLNPQLVGDTQDLETVRPTSSMPTRSRVVHDRTWPRLLRRGADRPRVPPRWSASPRRSEHAERRTSLLDVGAVEYDIADLQDLDDELGIGLAIWSGAAGNNLFEDSLNWYGSNPPDAGRGWLVNDPMLTVELPDGSGAGGAAVLGTLASFRERSTSSRRREAPPFCRCRRTASRLPERDLPGLVFPSILNLDEAVTVESDVIEAGVRILLNRGTLSLDDAIILGSDSRRLRSGRTADLNPPRTRRRPAERCDGERVRSRPGQRWSHPRR